MQLPIPLLSPTQIAAFEGLVEKAASLPNDDARLALARECGDRTVGELLESALAEPASINNLSPGTRLGGYWLVERLGGGGFGDVWQARRADDPSVEVALKLIRPQHLLRDDSQQFIAMFREEVARHAGLRHEGIVALIDAGSVSLPGLSRPIPFLAMELWRGRPLHHALRGSSIVQKVGCFVSVCRAVQYAHRHGLIHLDLKPDNILVSVHSGVARAKVLDFGLSRAFRADRPLEGPRFGAGTLPYQAPEQIDPRLGGEDFRTDVHALGVILFQLLTEHLPYPLREGTLAEYRKYICEGPRLDPRDFDENLDPGLVEILARATAIKRSSRYDSPERLAVALEDWLQETVSTAASSSGQQPPRPPRLRKARWVLALGVPLVAAAWLASFRLSNLSPARLGVWRQFPINIVGQPLEEEPIWHDIQWLGEEGWLVGGTSEGGGPFVHVGHGVMLHTTDGGRSWYQLDSANFESGRGTNRPFMSVFTDLGPITSLVVDRQLDLSGTGWRTNAYIATSTGIYSSASPGDPMSKWHRVTPGPGEEEGYSHFLSIRTRGREFYITGWPGILRWQPDLRWKWDVVTFTNPVCQLAWGPIDTWAVTSWGGNPAGADHGGILRLRDGGRLWEQESLSDLAFQPGQNFSDITWADQTRELFVVGATGLIIRSRLIGTNCVWRSLRSGINENLHAVRTGENQTLWVVGDHGTILASVDDGESWRKFECKDAEGKKITKAFKFIRFIRPDNGWILGQDVVLKFESAHH